LALPIGLLDHVAIAVADLDAACERYETLLGGQVVHREIVPGQPVEVAFVKVPGETLIELITATAADTPLARFVAGRGEGLHHICFRVEDLEAALRQAESDGLELIDHHGRPGAAGSRIGFLHPRAAGGVLVELKQKGASG
jgi:methylmalonyl-CoA epimerase